MNSNAQTPMKRIRIEKVTVNMGVGKTGEDHKRAMEIMQKITGVKPVQTMCKVKIPAWGIREGLAIGCKVTLRKAKAKEKTLSKKSFDKVGNLGFGIKEYIDLPGSKYDPKLGIRGFDVLVTLERPGYRIKKRRNNPSPVGKAHLITQDEAVQFMQEKFGVKVI
jgi:large subunit ribosomal protein L5